MPLQDPWPQAGPAEPQGGVPEPALLPTAAASHAAGAAMGIEGDLVFGRRPDLHQSRLQGLQLSSGQLSYGCPVFHHVLANREHPAADEMGGLVDQADQPQVARPVLGSGGSCIGGHVGQPVGLPAGLVAPCSGGLLPGEVGLDLNDPDPAVCEEPHAGVAAEEHGPGLAVLSRRPGRQQTAGGP